MHAVNIFEQVNWDNLVVVIDVAVVNVSLDQVLTQWDHNYMPAMVKQLQKRGIRRFYHKPQRMDYQKYEALLKMHTYLMQCMVSTSTEFETDKLKEINHLEQQAQVQVICTNTYQKFNNYYFMENGEYYNTINHL